MNYVLSAQKLMIKFDLGFWNLNNRFDQGFQILLLKLFWIHQNYTYI